VVVAGSVAIYHLRVLRADSRRFAAAVPAETPTTAQVMLQVRAADVTTLERALATLRSTGVEVVVLDRVNARLTGCEHIRDLGTPPEAAV
jgi:hypothetical protein